MVVGDKGEGEQVNSPQYFTWVFAGIVRCVKERLPKEVKQARTILPKTLQGAREIELNSEEL